VKELGQVLRETETMPPGPRQCGATEISWRLWAMSRIQHGLFILQRMDLMIFKKWKMFLML
jgi:hypothetical protein